MYEESIPGMLGWLQNPEYESNNPSPTPLGKALSLKSYGMRNHEEWARIGNGANPDIHPSQLIPPLYPLG
jgi:hypothetical protein